MAKKEEYEKFKKNMRFDLNLYIRGIVAFVLVSIAILSFVVNSYNDRIENIECGMGIKDCDTVPKLVTTPTPNPLEGWEEECMLNKTIEHKDFKVMKSVVLNCVTDYIPKYCFDKTKNSSYMFLDYYNCIDGTEDLFDRLKETLYWGFDLYHEEDIKLLDSIGCYEQFIERWNETVCIKKILVKEE